MLVFLILIVVTALFFGVCYFTYRIVFYSSTKNRIDILDSPAGEEYLKRRPELAALVAQISVIPFEEVYITAKDGTALFAKYYHIKDGAPVHIQCHGYRGSGIRDFCGGNKMAREMGHNTLLIDQRGHGKSGGEQITFGIKERFDVISWCDYVIERFGANVQIILSGISMGAATVLMASGLELPKNVKGIIADCPYSSAEGIIRKVCTDMKLWHKIMFPLVKIGARLYGGFNISEVTADGAVENSKTPILIIHGKGDKFVPCDMSDSIFKKCPKGAVYETFEGAGHGMSFVSDRNRYTKICTEFINRCLRI